MHRKKASLILLAASLCSGVLSASLSISARAEDATPGVPVTSPTPTAPAMTGDTGRGSVAAHRLCASCHTFESGGHGGVGPNLYGVVGRPVASGPGFFYSSALRGKAEHWSAQNLDEWLRNPRSFAPGTRMSFPGIADAQVRADIIAYLSGNAPSGNTSAGDTHAPGTTSGSISPSPLAVSPGKGIAP